MIEALASSAAQIGADGAATGNKPLAPPNFNDVERFRASMMAPQAAAAEAVITAPAATPVAIAPVGPTATELARPLVPAVASDNKASNGDSILGAMQDLSADTKARFAQVGDVLAKPNLTMTDLMSLQFTLLQTSLQFEIVSKGISKSTQNLESILKTS